MKDRQHSTNDFHRTGKIKKAACKTFSVLTKNEEKFVNFLIFFKSKSHWKIDFFTIFTK